MKTISAIGIVWMFSACSHADAPAIRFGDVSPRGYAQRAEVGETACTTVYISGQLPLNSNGDLVGEGSVELQTAQVFENIKQQVERAGGTMEDIVYINCYFTDLSTISEFRKARDKYINLENPPASTVVQVSGLLNEKSLIEVNAIAVLKNGR